ncbi:CIS tube protein [Desulfuribacillus alkaliarsenatis]|uniref:Contractile injection system tube protein N-terminal domain-containing protein n=1 Tax=Desulfuribacillus alkaliarsenatis TaxID=766136 RepID=A0A1E5G2B3_9FIRM|nr:hypothetical protein [Desulfuribacillus alkaliarsenatis]OEF97115.1 hypothetical protein BHF68_05830 [Desulfuribacillus alkaliarsenatis]
MLLDIGKPEKAKIKFSGQELTVQFNPNKLSITDGVNYSETVTMGWKSPRKIPSSQYRNHNARELKVELLFDTYTSMYIESLKKDVKKEYIDKFIKLIEGTDKPPVITFSWGSIQFKGLITAMSYTYTMFTKDGKPVRATMSLSIKEYGNLL